MKNTSKPNFIFIMTDDQDLHMDSLKYMPAVQAHFGNEGTFYERHYCTVSKCCPSRVSLLTGKAAHNTNVTAVSAPYGGYAKFVSQGWNDKYLPVWLQDAGYNTYYTGKLMNDHSDVTYNKPFPRGWNGSDFLIDPDAYVYWGSTTQRNQDPPKRNPDLYSTDMIGANAIGFLEEAAESERPFFLGVAPIGPHSELIRASENGSTTMSFHPPVPADRHKHLFPDVKIPRTLNFNPDKASGASWIKTLGKMNDTAVQSADDYYRKRLQALQSVDEMVEDIMQWLSKHPSLLENTYLIYTTDNGFHMGQHRLPPGKTCGIEEDINIPFFMRGPGISKGKVYHRPTSHLDILPTLFSLAGIPMNEDFDGEPIPMFGEDDEDDKPKTEHVNVEFWGYGLLEGVFGPTGSGLVPYPGLISGDGVQGANNTYKTIRVIGDGYNLMYTVWCTNEHELYEMNSDPYQMYNLYDSNARINGWNPECLRQRLDTLLLVLKRCSGKVCTRPWASLHPTGDVTSLRDAIDSRFDAFYKGQPQVAFTACALGQLLEVEGSLQANVFT
ncbi:hypothetical protein Q7P37_010964 [Cladosporium fusiforme]